MKHKLTRMANDHCCRKGELTTILEAGDWQRIKENVQ
jgi:hypothetical protein